MVFCHANDLPRLRVTGDAYRRNLRDPRDCGGMYIPQHGFGGPDGGGGFGSSVCAPKVVGKATASREVRW